MEFVSLLVCSNGASDGSHTISGLFNYIMCQNEKKHQKLSYYESDMTCRIRTKGFCFVPNTLFRHHIYFKGKIGIDRVAVLSLKMIRLRTLSSYSSQFSSSQPQNFMIK
jgi:hypothetical protein